MPAAVSCSVVTSSSGSLPNDGESPRALFPKCNYGKISVKRAFSLVPGTQQNEWYS